VILVGHFKKFLEMIFGRLSLPLEVALDSRYKLLTGVTGFLIVITTAGCYGDTMGSLLLPLLATRSAFSATFDGGFGGRGPATVGRRSRVA
jgi:hypothetical protein